ncbi:MAG: hypothetical protein AAB493_00920 [Patescibacteria group bacterium]
MPRNLLQDIKKIETTKRNKILNKYIPAVSKINEANINNNEEQKIKGSRYTLWIVALISLIFLFFALSFLFSKATVTINPKIKTLSLNQNLSAVKDSNTDKLSFDLVVLSDQESRLIKGGEEKDLKESAKGKVLLYNKFSSSPQLLLINTRLEGSNSKIYKTKTKTVIPGMNKDGTPGKVSVDIYALAPGEEYNSIPLDFKIFGFKGTSKYSKFDGRSVGDITGGFIGKSRQITDIQKTIAEKELKTSLENKLFNKVVSQIPEGFVLFKDATFFNIDDSDISPTSPDGSITINVQGTLYGFIFNEKKLTKKIVEFFIPDYDGSEVYISNIKDLTFALSNKEGIIFNDVTSIDFNIYGVQKVVYKFDSTKLVSELPGKNKKDFNQILSQYQNIDSASLSIRPIWKLSFPEKSKNIKVIVNYPK